MRGWNGYGLYHDGFAMGFPWMGLALGILFLAVVTLLVILAIRMSKRPYRVDPPKPGRALDILAERFARGEIDAAAFREMKAELEGHPAEDKS
jgi:putative membrane protein